MTITRDKSAWPAAPTRRVVYMGGPIVHVEAIPRRAGVPRPASVDLARALRQLVEAPTAAHRGPRRTR